MRITFILPIVNMSGGIRVISIYAKALCEMGHEIVLVSPPRKRISTLKKIVCLLKGDGWPRTISTASHLDGLGLEHRVLNMFRPVTDSDIPDADVVIATWWETAEWVMKLSDAKGAKVYFVQGHEVYSHLPVERCKATYCMPMHKIVISQWLERIMHNDYHDSNVDLVLNSIDHEQFFATERTKQAQPTVGFLYNINACKGMDVTLEVIRNLKKQFSNLRVISFGSSEMARDMLGSHIDFYHAPEQNAIRDLYAQCDLWLTSSRLEGFNLTAMEAMACGTPVVSTMVGWPEESITTGYNGALVDVDDSQSLTKEASTILLLADKDWIKMSENAYNTVAESTWDESAKLFEKSLMNACSRSKKKEIAGSCASLCN